MGWGVGWGVDVMGSVSGCLQWRGIVSAVHDETPS